MGLSLRFADHNRIDWRVIYLKAFCELDVNSPDSLGFKERQRREIRSLALPRRGSKGLVPPSAMSRINKSAQAPKAGETNLEQVIPPEVDDLKDF